MAPGFHGKPYEVSASQVLLHLAYLNVFFGDNWLNPVFWTLAVEFQYYLLVGLLFPLIAHRNFWVRLSLFAILGALSFVSPRVAFIPHWFFLFMLGMLAFQHHARLINGTRFWIVLVLLGCGATFTLGPLMASVGLITACAIIFANISNRFFLFLGTISYSLYLVHVPIGGKAINLGSRFVDGMAGKVLVLLLSLMVSIAAAYILYRFVEKPAQAWSSRIRYRKRVSESANPLTTQVSGIHSPP